MMNEMSKKTRFGIGLLVLAIGVVAIVILKSLGADVPKTSGSDPRGPGYDGMGLPDCNNPCFISSRFQGALNQANSRSANHCGSFGDQSLQVIQRDKGAMKMAERRQFVPIAAIGNALGWLG